MRERLDFQLIALQSGQIHWNQTLERCLTLDLADTDSGLSSGMV